MAVTQNTYTGNGSTTNYSLTFQYLEEDEIKVSLNGTLTTAYTLANATTISFTTAPANGVAIRIYRDTNVDSLQSTFFAGSAIRAQDLNDNFNQVLYSTQETVARRVDSTGGSMTGNLEFSAGKGIVFEGATDDAHETTLLGGDPTADRTLNLPNVSGTLVSTGDTGTVATAMIADSNVTTAKIADSNVTTAKIADANITTAKLADGSVTSAKIADGTIVADDIASSAVTTAKILDSNVTTAKIADSNVTTAKLADGAVTSAKIADGTIVAGDIATDAVITSKILDQNVTTAKIADQNVTTAKIADLNVTTGKINDQAVTAAKIADGVIDSTKLTGATVVTNAEHTGSTPNDTSFFTTSASDSRYFRQDSSETITSGNPWSSSDTYVATTAAIDARVIDLVDDVGGFVPITNETSFPVNNPDINSPDGAGTIVSIKEIVTTRTPVSGTVTITNGAGSNTVTINGCGSTVLASGFGVLVETTSTLHTYNFHRLVPKATEVTTVAGISGDITTVATNNANVTAVAGNAANINTVSTNIANVNNVGGSIANVNSVASNLGTVNDFAARYRVASSDPVTSLDTGDLVFNTTNNELRVYNGTAWQGGVTATGNLVSKSGDTMTGPLGITAGTAALPSLFVSGDPNTGIYSPGADQLAVSTGGSQRLLIDASGNISAGGTLTAASFIPSSSTVPTNGVYLPAANTVAISTNGSGRLFVDASGRVGINKAIPSQTLQVVSATGGTTARFENTSSGNFVDFYETTGGTRMGYIGHTSATDMYIHNDKAGPLIFDTNNTERLRITSAGLVGIGTSSPGSNLDVRGSSTGTLNLQGGSAYAQLTLTDGGGGVNYIESTNANFSIKTNNSSWLRLGTNNTTAVHIDSSQRVGIGTQSPNSSLNVVPSSNAIGLTIHNRSADDYGYLRFQNNAGTETQAAIGCERSGASAGRILFETAGSERARIDSSGNFGIGASGNLSKLTVGTGNNLSASALVAFNTANANINALTLSNWTGTAATQGPRIAFDNSGVGAWTIGSANSVDAFDFCKTWGTPAVRIDGNSRLLVGTSSSRTVGSSVAWYAQIEGTATGSTYPGLALTTNSNSTECAYLALGKTRGTSVGSNTIVQNGDALGQIVFAGADGTDLETRGAAIEAYVDGTPGANDMPGRLVFSTTADGASSPTERLRIANNGQLSAVVPGNSTLYPGFLARAWVNFNGTSTVSIRANGNVSSITDNGTGDYTVNFTTAMPDVNYSVCLTASIQGTTSTNGGYITGLSRNTTPATSSVRFETSTTAALTDTLNANVAIFR